MQLSALELASLKQLPLFGRLAPEAFERVIDCLRLETCRVGQTLCRQGEPARACFVVVEGWMKLSRVSATGAEAVIHICSRGQSFAEAAALTGAPHEVSAESVSPALVARLPAGSLTPVTAGLVFAAPMLMNTLVKAGLTVAIGGGRAGWAAAAPLVLSVAVAAGSLALLPGLFG